MRLFRLLFLLVFFYFLGTKFFSNLVESGSSPFTNGAVTVRTFYLEQYNGKAITCNGASDAQIKVEVTGSSDYEVTLNSTFQTIPNTFPTTFSNLSANLYTISVFDYDNFLQFQLKLKYLMLLNLL